MRGMALIATPIAALAATVIVPAGEAQAACAPGSKYLDDASGINYACLGGQWEAVGDVPVAKVPRIIEPGEAFLPGKYSVPGEMAYGTWMAQTREGAYPPCLYYTFTHDGIIIDAFLADFNGGPMTAELHSPAIASFQGSENCTPWVKVD
ncbi:hypothetical protein PDG61_21115 [Mycolicibacterium sp. BiH015]|uniref:hypothetical protein n=1 Tax=Mycolicibacterium sp. BiH015 TaxID=3018808 RepID=UPI0022E530ED|nr:hypothetical protein [Mycolicibacterium sp. BiH015]MDA2893429.1 hypothetical protein [Mycolicibacterium sp. BiH015]